MRGHLRVIAKKKVPPSGGANYNVWDMKQNATDLATNESLGGSNDITESGGEQTLDGNTTGAGNAIYTYDSFSAVDSNTFYYVDLQFKLNESFGTNYQNNYIAYLGTSGQTSPSTVTKVFMFYLRYRGSNSWDMYLYGDNGGSVTFGTYAYTAGGGSTIRLRLRIKADGATNIGYKIDSNAAGEIATDGTVDVDGAVMFLGSTYWNATGNITFTEVGITTDISEIGLATWE